MVILFIWTLMFLLAAYIWVGRTIYEDIASYYILNVYYAIALILLWPLIMPVLFLISQIVSLCYTIRKCLR